MTEHCKNCGKKLSGSYTFCGFCGVSIGHSKAEGLSEEESGIDANSCGARIVDNGSDAEVWNQKGLDFDAQGNNKEALKCFYMALELESENDEIWINAGMALDNLGHYKDAAECYSRALEINPNNTEVWYTKGISLLKSDQHGDAISCFDRLLSINAVHAAALYSKAVAEDALGKESAIASFSLFLKNGNLTGFEEHVRYAKTRLQEHSNLAYCKNCGKENSSNSAFCVSCGSSLNLADVQENGEHLENALLYEDQSFNTTGKLVGIILILSTINFLLIILRFIGIVPLIIIESLLALIFFLFKYKGQFTTNWNLLVIPSIILLISLGVNFIDGRRSPVRLSIEELYSSLNAGSPQNQEYVGKEVETSGYLTNAISSRELTEYLNEYVFSEKVDPNDSSGVLNFVSSTNDIDDPINVMFHTGKDTRYLLNSAVTIRCLVVSIEGEISLLEKDTCVVNRS